MSGQSQPSGLTLPPAFPDDLFEQVKNRAGTKVPTGSSAAEHLGGSYNGVRYRLKACADYSEEFTHSINTFGESPPPHGTLPARAVIVWVFCFRLFRSR
jgi:hypothetical protein